MDTSGSLFQLAADFIHYTNRSIFLTGKAGTGKTTFLKHIKEHTAKQTVVLAPTGVAAINAGGATIHSFFQLPLSPYVPASTGFEKMYKSQEQSIDARYEVMNKHHLLSRMKFSKEKIELLRELELLIIDEISMVRCDVLDAIDTVLRHFRYRYYEPFGGVQILLIGDMYQLPPVVTDNEWNILNQFYQTPYFFSSKVYEQHPLFYIQLQKIFRQSNARFIELLNMIRNNEMDEYGMNLLHSRYQPDFFPKKDAGFITLTTHNYKAEAINTNALNSLRGDLFSFNAKVEGEFYEKSYPADELLQLKCGAQVMFIKNDTEERKYFNGKIGTVQKIESDKIFVECGSENIIEVKKEKWENIRYTLNKDTQRVDEEMMGSFTQFPLRLAWAITIHKSQGLTFEKAVIDAGAAFAPGQVYVALSRCTSLEGLVLHSRINNTSLYTDERIKTFVTSQTYQGEILQELTNSKHAYQQKIITGLFDFSLLIKDWAALIADVEKHASSFNLETLPWLHAGKERMEGVQNTALKFQVQLNKLMQEQQLAEENIPLQKRIEAASKYFQNEIDQLLQLLKESPAITDNKQQATSYNKDIKDLHTQLAMKYYLISDCIKGFRTDIYHRMKQNFIAPPFAVNSYSKSSSLNLQTPHPALYKSLKKLRDTISDTEKMPVYFVAGSNTLSEMARYLPQTLDELSCISGFGKTKIEKYGQQFVEIICTYCNEHNLSSLIIEKIPKRQRNEKNANRTNTKSETFVLYQSGKTIDEIASARNLAPQTIEGHLAYYVQQGQIAIEELLSKEKLEVILPVAEKYDGNSLTPLKEKLGSNVSFGEIRLALSWIEFKNKR